MAYNSSIQAMHYTLKGCLLYPEKMDHLEVEIQVTAA